MRRIIEHFKSQKWMDGSKRFGRWKHVFVRIFQRYPFPPFFLILSKKHVYIRSPIVQLAIYANLILNQKIRRNVMRQAWKEHNLQKNEKTIHYFCPHGFVPYCWSKAPSCKHIFQAVRPLRHLDIISKQLLITKQLWDSHLTIPFFFFCVQSTKKMIHNEAEFSFNTKTTRQPIPYLIFLTTYTIIPCCCLSLVHETSCVI